MLRRSVFLVLWNAAAIALECLLYLACEPWLSCLSETTQNYIAAAVICFLLGHVLLTMVTMSREQLLRALLSIDGEDDSLDDLCTRQDFRALEVGVTRASA